MFNKSSELHYLHVVYHKHFQLTISSLFPHRQSWYATQTVVLFVANILDTNEFRVLQKAKKDASKKFINDLQKVSMFVRANLYFKCS